VRECASQVGEEVCIRLTPAMYVRLTIRPCSWIEALASGSPGALEPCLVTIDQNVHPTCRSSVLVMW